MPADDAIALQSSTDAVEWTEAFLKRFTVYSNGAVTDEERDNHHAWEWGLMVGWFANAIEVGRSAGRAEAINNG